MCIFFYPVILVQITYNTKTLTWVCKDRYKDIHCRIVVMAQTFILGGFLLKIIVHLQGAATKISSDLFQKWWHNLCIKDKRKRKLEKNIYSMTPLLKHQNTLKKKKTRKTYTRFLTVFTSEQWVQIIYLQTFASIYFWCKKFLIKRFKIIQHKRINIYINEKGQGA